MIKKIGTIKHFAVFENYNWDLSSTDKNGQLLKFEKINILYGRNYSGKKVSGFIWILPPISNSLFWKMI